MDITFRDPIDWGIEEVVAFLCDPLNAPWAESSKSPRPDLVALEAAIRKHQITGEALLYDVDREAIKNDLGIETLGPRSSVLRAIDWLRARSVKYQIKQVHPSSTRSSQPPSIEYRLSSVNSPSITASADPSTRIASASTETMPAPAGMKPKRRIAPIQVIDLNGQGVNDERPQKGKTPLYNQAPELSPPVISGFQESAGESVGDVQLQHPSLSDHAVEKESAPKGAPLDVPLSVPVFSDEFFDALLQKYQVEDDTIEASLEDSESEYDEETLEELMEDELELAPAPPETKLSRDQCERVFSEFIAQYEEIWRQKHLPKHQRFAQYVWQQSRDVGKGKAYKNDASNSLKKLSHRLQTQKNMLFEAGYISEASLREGCSVMGPTIDSICLEKWKLATIELETCPAFVPPPPRASRPRKKRIINADEVSLSSDSSVESASDTEWIVADDEDSGDEDSADEGSGDEAAAEGFDSDTGNDIPYRPARSLLGPDPKTAWPVVSSSDENVEMFAAKKRRRMNGSGNADEREATVSSSKPGPFSELEDENPDLPRTEHDMPITALQLASSPQAPQDSDMADDMLVETPPLNPTLPATSPGDVDVEEGLLVKTPPLNPINLPQKTTRLKLIPSPRKPPHESDGPQSPDTKTPQVATSYRSSPSMDDIDLFDMVKDMRSSEIEKHDHERFGSYLEELMDPVYMEEVTAVLQAMLDNQWHLEGRTAAQSGPPMRLGAYFVSWHSCKMLTPKGMGREPTEKALETLEDEGACKMFLAFLHRLRKMYASYTAWRLRQPPQAQTQESYSDTLGSDTSPSTRKRKHRARPRLTAFGPRQLSNLQRDAQRRQAQQDKARQRLLKERERMGLSNSDPEKQAVTFKDPVIYLHPQLGRFVKPHQLTGIQFMWRELIEADNPQGCLLAHVMGLGKSMQVISLLVTIAATAASDDPKIREQVPKRFHRSQTLVLCPSSVVQNWVEEFAFWVPSDHQLGPILHVSPRGKSMAIERSLRLHTIQEWNGKGGVLIMSYEMLRILITNSSNALDEVEHEFVKDCLLSKSRIVIADEAHKLRSDKSAISQVASRFQSKSRIALTGSPLSNQLSEYYQMLEWVAPGYLEDPATFRKKFMDPIQAGSYIDSTAAEQRESLVALQLLNGILAPKVLRADTSVLAGDLPPKTEFLITIPLTELQRKAYDTFVECAQSGVADASPRLWSWLAIMQLCCNHPYPFLDKIADRAGKDDTEGQSILPKSMQEAGLPSDLRSRMELIFGTYPDLRDIPLSNRAILLDQILDLSLRAGDKVLIFSQSIPTMNFLDFMLRSRGRRYQRIDGATPGPDRQDIVKRFNTDGRLQILLISTRAGGVGLNMFGANRVVIFDFLFNPMWEEQAVGRAYRLGQKKPVYVYRFVSGGTFEEFIFNNATFKRQLAVRVVDKKTVVRESSKQTSSYLRPVQEVQRDAQHEALGWDPLVLDHILRGECKEIVLKARLSHIRDNENDHLTEEEKRKVEDELQMERLKRSDPRAYHAELKRREDAERVRQQEWAQKLQMQRDAMLVQQGNPGQAVRQQGAMIQQRPATLDHAPIPMIAVGGQLSPLTQMDTAQPNPSFLGMSTLQRKANSIPSPLYLPGSSSPTQTRTLDRVVTQATCTPRASSMRHPDVLGSELTFMVPAGTEVITIDSSDSNHSTPANAHVGTSPEQAATSESDLAASNLEIGDLIDLDKMFPPPPTGQDLPAPTSTDLVPYRGSGESAHDIALDNGGDGSGASGYSEAMDMSDDT